MHGREGDEVTFTHLHDGLDWHRAALGAALAIGVGIASCTPYVEPTHPPILLKTAAAPVAPADCPLSGLDGTLVETAATGLGIVDASGATVNITWPFGYSASPSVAGGILFAPNGQPPIYTGEPIRFTGGAIGADGTWVACGAIERLPS
jgi:hypothetical protein